MFSRRTSTRTPAETEDDSVLPDPAQRPKGRPTPSRKDAERRRRQTLKVPSDPKAAKKAMREREKESRRESRAGLVSGDERFMPPRDKGPAKAFTRDYVDGRRRFSEYFVFVAVGILVAGFVRNNQVQGLVALVWLAITLVVAGEVSWMLLRLGRELRERWPEPSDRKGCKLYAVLRSLQIRKLRVPPPRIKVGGTPVSK